MIDEKTYLVACEREGCHALPFHIAYREVANTPMCYRVLAHLQISKKKELTEEQEKFVETAVEVLNQNSKRGENDGV